MASTCLANVEGHELRSHLKGFICIIILTAAIKTHLSPISGMLNAQLTVSNFVLLSAKGEKVSRERGMQVEGLHIWFLCSLYRVSVFSQLALCT